MLPLLDACGHDIKRRQDDAERDDHCEYQRAGADDIEFISDFNWSKVVGKRYAFSRVFVQAPHVQPKLMIFAAVFCNFKYMVAWSLSKTHTSGCALHPLLDMVSDIHSPVLRCLQYCRTLVTTVIQDRLYAVIMLSQAGSRDELVRNHPLSHTCGTSVKGTVAWLWWRNLRFKRGPFSFAKTADSRVPGSAKLVEVRRLHKANRCCHDIGCTLKLVARASRPEGMLDPRNRMVAEWDFQTTDPQCGCGDVA